MKKLLVLLALCMVLTVALVACETDPGTTDESTAGSTEAPTQGETEAPTTETQAPTTEETTETPTTETQAPTTETTTEEETTTEAPDPADPTWFMDAAGLAEKAASGNMMTAELNAEEGYVRLTATGGDPFFQFLSAAGVQPQYMAIVYRTNTTRQGQIFIGSGAGPNAQGDNPLFSWNGNEQWNILVLDLANTEGLTSITDGDVNYARLDFFTDQGAEGDYIDLKYVGFYNTAKYATDAFFANIATIIPAADMASSIPGSPGVNGCTLSADGTYVTIDTIGQGDPYYQLPMLNGKGTVGAFVAIKYRSTSTHVVSEMFVGSGAGPSGQGDNIQFTLVCDGKWQLAIVDLSQASAVVDNVINYLRWDPFAGAATATIDMAYIGVFASEADALAYDATVADLYVDTLNVPVDSWEVTGHKTGVQDSSDGMVAAGGVEKGALLHQGYISLGEINLAEMSKVVILYGLDGSQVTIDLHAAAEHNRILLTSADQSMTNSPTDDVIIASAEYVELGWNVKALVIDLSEVDYNGPVYVTYDTLPGTFMLIAGVEFTYDPNYVEPEPPAEDPYYAISFNQVNLGATYYFTGAMDGYYLATSTNAADAAKVYVENHEEGLRMYVLVDGVKNYVEIYEYENNGQMKGGVHMTTEPTTFFVFNEDAQTYVTDLGETGIFYLGTYKTYSTVSASNISYITGESAANVGVSQFPIEWVEFPTVEEPEEPAVYEGKWHTSVDSFMYCVQDDFSDVVTFAGAATNNSNGTTIANASGSLASVTAKYVYFAGGWIAVDGYSLENWACDIIAADGTVLKTVELGLKEAEEGVLTHVANNMGYAGVPNRLGNESEIIALGEYAGQTVKVVYRVDAVDTDYTINLIELEVIVP